ncbi:hypothetical protein MAR_033026 [Mya arenaria]|uniref:Secreted protein n=1 Tax=Mya arenaria TaxID=6604 RepID=A0ABY7GAK1_MYAAR|nr:hypothetical protein MAR_033026 [Mya arenaria]
MDFIWRSIILLSCLSYGQSSGVNTEQSLLNALGFDMNQALSNLNSATRNKRDDELFFVAVVKAFFVGLDLDHLRAYSEYKTCFKVPITDKCIAADASYFEDLAIASTSFMKCNDQSHHFFSKYGADVQCGDEQYQRYLTGTAGVYGLASTPGQTDEATTAIGTKFNGISLVLRQHGKGIMHYILSIITFIYSELTTIKTVSRDQI